MDQPRSDGPPTARVVRCVLADSSPIRGQILEKMIEAHPQIQVISRVRSVHQLRNTFGDEEIDSYLVDWDLVEAMGSEFFEGLPPSVSRRVLVLVPRDLAEKGPLDALRGSDFIGRPTSPFELESMGMQLTSSLVAAYVIRHGILPSEKAMLPGGRAPEFPPLGRVTLVVAGWGGDELLEAMIPRMRDDRGRGFLIVLRHMPRKQREMVGRWLLDHDLTVLLGARGRRFQLGRVHVIVSDGPLVLDRTDAGRGLTFSEAPPVAATPDSSTLDLLLASFARYLGQHLSCVVLGDRHPEEFSRGLYLVRRFGGAVYVPAQLDDGSRNHLLPMKAKKLIDVTFKRDQIDNLFLTS